MFICGNFLSSFCSSSIKKPVTPPLPPSASISFSTSSSSSASKKPSIPALLLLLFSWASFGLAVVLLGGATSMSATQPFPRLGGTAGRAGGDEAESGPSVLDGVGD
ncbi:unnamed protein product [Linum tenue]|uniref:Uncharacterized protein n=1 Tax=Linum tenue TaxID=586396 RepID=A0AAV0MT36_9ROSI|nr:unnamed protein product [Linum tenue]